MHQIGVAHAGRRSQSDIGVLSLERGPEAAGVVGYSSPVRGVDEKDPRGGLGGVRPRRNALLGNGGMLVQR